MNDVDYLTGILEAVFELAENAPRDENGDIPGEAQDIIRLAYQGSYPSNPT